MNQYLKQHQLMARGEGLLEGTFGVEPLSHTQKAGPTSPVYAAPMPDSKRHPLIGGNQAQPDHGPHGSE